MAATSSRTAWEHWSDEDLLEVRICDLKVRLRGSEVEPRVRQLHDELEEAGLPLRPVCYLSDEWQCGDGETSIGIPFFLAHPRLKALEFRMMLEVEGGTPTSCMRLLRHEAGHALDHAYRLHSRPDWREVFGSPRAPYNPYFYPVDPRSRAFVRNLPDYYAQCHPQEDFAETFAVWLNPFSQWRTRYAGWPALRKLRYVDRLMRELRGKRAPRRKPRLVAPAHQLRTTLKRYYERKMRLYRLDDLSFALADLKRIFRASRAADPHPRASALIRRHRRTLVESIHGWTGERPTHVARVLTQLARMCDEHRLVLRESPEASVARFSSFVAAMMVSHALTHTYRLRRS